MQNGREFATHEEIPTALDVDFYFAHPQFILGAKYKRIDPAVFPQEPGLHHNHREGNKNSDGKIEQSSQKTTWIQGTQSGILQVRRCTSNLNPRILLAIN